VVHQEELPDGLGAGWKLNLSRSMSMSWTARATCEIISKSPTTGVATPKKEQNIRKHLAPVEYNSVLSVAGGNTRDYAIFQVFLQTGLRH